MIERLLRSLWTRCSDGYFDHLVATNAASTRTVSWRTLCTVEYHLRCCHLYRTLGDILFRLYDRPNI